MQVNLEAAFAVNFVTNVIWLWATGRLAGVGIRPARLAGAAGVGAVAAVCAYFPAGGWLTSGVGLLLGTGALLLLAFWPAPRQRFMRACAYFLLSGGAMAGAVLLVGGHAPVGAGIDRFRMGPLPVESKLVAAGLLLMMLGARHLWEASRQRAGLAEGLWRLRVRMGAQEAELPALLDTGNSLADPLSGRAVVVVEAEALAPLLPPAVLQATAAGRPELDSLPDLWARRCRLIPYRAVCERTGMLLSVRPDGAWVRPARAPAGAAWRSVEVLIGLAAGPLHPEGLYRALLPPGPDEGWDPANRWEGETG